MDANFINGIVWGLIFFGIGFFIASFDNTFSTIISFLIYGFSGLCFLRAFRIF